jgi:hypothetical protein
LGFLEKCSEILENTYKDFGIFRKVFRDFGKYIQGFWDFRKVFRDFRKIHTRILGFFGTTPKKIFLGGLRPPPPYTTIK